jgi:hypothetical protein
MYNQNILRRLVKKLVFILIMVMILMMMSCNTQRRAFRSLERAHRLAPELFQSDTNRTYTSIKTPAVSGVVQISQKPVTIQFPRQYTIEGRVIRDTIRATLTKLDSLNIQAEIECPDVQVETVEIKVPYPVVGPISFKEKFLISLKAIGIFTFITSILLFIYKTLRVWLK